MNFYPGLFWGQYSIIMSPASSELNLKDRRWRRQAFLVPVIDLLRTMEYL